MAPFFGAAEGVLAQRAIFRRAIMRLPGLYFYLPRAQSRKSWIARWRALNYEPLCGAAAAPFSPCGGEWERAAQLNAG